MCERVLGLYVEVLNEYSADHWQVLELDERDFNRRDGREFELRRTNPSGTQGWVAGTFTRESLTGLRDMLTSVLESTDPGVCEHVRRAGPAENGRGLLGPDWTGGVDPVDWVRGQRD